MDRSTIRNAAISCLIACGTLVAGAGVFGSAVASADDFFGIDISDIFGDGNKSKMHHGGVEVGVAGRAPNLSAVPTGPRSRSVVIRGERPASGPAAPATTTPPLTAPRTRSVVIHGEPRVSVVSPPVIALLPAPVAPPVVALLPAPVAPPGSPPVVAPLPEPAVPSWFPPVVGPLPEPAVPPWFPPVVAPLGPPAPTTLAPAPSPAAPPSPQAAPESYRLGYPNYLREADVGGMLAVVMPGVAGLLVLTVGGVVLGYRQARTGQAASVGMEIARFLR